MKRKILSIILLLSLLLSCMLPLASCAPTPPECEHEDKNGDYVCDKCSEELPKPDPGDTPKDEVYTVIVETISGRRMSNVMVYLHDANDPDPYASVGRARTDKNGVATFTKSNQATYNVELEGVPNGYIVDDRYPFDSTRTAYIKLNSAPISADEEDFRDLDDDFYYELGDIIHDFTITDLNGKSHTVSDILKESQLLVLNFWYIGCDACIAEFPYLSEAYSKYNDLYGNENSNIVEILAINDHGDNRNTIKDFAENPYNSYKETYGAFEFPVCRAEDSGYATYSFIRKFFDTDQTGYPVSVFIDRYGTICCIEVGSMINTKYWTNAFDHFTSDDYQQKLVQYAEEFTVAEKPNLSMPSDEEMNGALSGDYLGTGNKIDVEYRAQTDDEYSWPFIIDTFDGKSVVKPSNFDKDNSYAILYADVYMNAGDALAFDYFSSTHKNDVMFVLVEGKDIYSISGINDYDSDGNPKWSTCCTYVAQYDGVYEVAFVYQKDIVDYSGDDTIYLSNLRIIDQSEIDVETYIFRYAAFNKSEDGSEFGGYANIVFNATDGYYHVGSEDGPLLFADLLNYTEFDRTKTVFERVYANVGSEDLDGDGESDPIFMVDGVNKFLRFEKHGNYAANSDMYGIVPVNEELRSFLEIYVDSYRRAVGKKANENLWLSICCYYDAYGTDGKQLPNPIKGLSAQSAYKAELDTLTTVTYNRTIVPRGYLHAFTPAVSGIYRFTTYSKSTVIGWLFTGDDNAWGEVGDRILLTSSDLDEERLSPALVKQGYFMKCPYCGDDITIFKEYDKDGNEIVPTVIKSHNAEYANEPCPDITDLTNLEPMFVRDYRNISLAAYLEAGETYYFAPAFHSVEELGSFDFKITYEGASFDMFVHASPGPFTFDEEGNGALGSTIAGGVKPVLCNDPDCADCNEMNAIQGDEAGTRYWHATNRDGSKGYILFADFFQTTTTFPANSVVDMFNKNAFGEYNDIIGKYIPKMLDEADFPERQGCVAVTAELAEALQYAIDTYTFPNIQNGWIKFCFYYKALGEA